MLNFEWHMLKSLCEISFLEFQIVVNISLSWEGGERRMCFQLPPTEFQSHLLPNPKESLPSPVFLSSRSFFRGEFRFECCVVTARNQMVFRCCLKKQNVCQKSSFFRFCCPVVTQCSKCPIFVQKFKFIKIFEFSRVKLVLFQCLSSNIWYKI